MRMDRRRKKNSSFHCNNNRSSREGSDLEGKGGEVEDENKEGDGTDKGEKA